MPKKKTVVKKEETKILYDSKAEQSIPLIARQGSQQSRCCHNLKPLSDERFFQFENELEVVEAKKPSLLADLYKPHFDLWKDLFIDRDGKKEKDSDALFTEAIQAVNALLYYESASTGIAIESDELLDDSLPFDDCSVTFAAMFSGALLGLTISYKPQFEMQIDRFQQSQRPQIETGISLTGYTHRKNQPIRKSERLYEFALPNVLKSEGYKNEIPAVHVVRSAKDIFLTSLYHLTASPVITAANYKG